MRKMKHLDREDEAGMDPITVILTALAAGASAGAIDELKDEVKDKAKAAYAKLRDLVTRRFREKGTANAEGALADYEKKPKVYQAGLEDKLRESDADRDSELMEAAKTLLEFVQQQGPASAKYSVRIDGAEGVIVGDHATQTNTFGTRP